MYFLFLIPFLTLFSFALLILLSQSVFSSLALYLNLFFLLHSSSPLMVELKSWLWDSNSIWGFCQRVFLRIVCVRACVHIIKCLVFLLWQKFFSFFYNDLYCDSIAKMCQNSLCDGISKIIKSGFAVHTVYVKSKGKVLFLLYLVLMTASLSKP